jgi:phospholipase D-like protein
MNSSLAVFFSPQDLLLLIILVVAIGFPIWMLVDCLINESNEGNSKLIWVLVIIFAPLGSLIYFFVRKIRRSKPHINS